MYLELGCFKGGGVFSEDVLRVGVFLKLGCIEVGVYFELGSIKKCPRVRVLMGEGV